jgi:hypothetical protein
MEGVVSVTMGTALRSVGNAAKVTLQSPLCIGQVSPCEPGGRSDTAQWIIEPVGLSRAGVKPVGRGCAAGTEPQDGGTDG